MSTEDQNVPVVPPVVPPVAAAAAPAVPATTEAEAQIVPHSYGEIEGDPGLTMALDFVGKLGLGPSDPAIQAAMKGDFAFIKAKLASLGSKAQGFEHYIALAEKSFESQVQLGAEKIAAAQVAIHSAVGGEENWQAIQKWASENADETEKKEINAMLNQGGFQARAAAALLNQLYTNAPGTVVNPAVAAPGQGARSAPASGSPLNAQQYAAEVAKLVKQHGTRGAYTHPDMAVLDQRRQNSRN